MPAEDMDAEDGEVRDTGKAGAPLVFIDMPPDPHVESKCALGGCRVKEQGSGII